MPINSLGYMVKYFENLKLGLGSDKWCQNGMSQILILNNHKITKIWVPINSYHTYILNR